MFSRSICMCYIISSKGYDYVPSEKKLCTNHMNYNFFKFSKKPAIRFFTIVIIYSSNDTLNIKQNINKNVRKLDMTQNKPLFVSFY